MLQIFDIDEIEKIMGETKEAAEYQDVMPILIFWLVANTTEVRIPTAVAVASWMRSF